MIANLTFSSAADQWISGKRSDYSSVLVEADIGAVVASVILQ
jgi:hypothetical protein